MAPRCRHGFCLDHTGPPTALGPMRPLPIAWIMFANVCSWHTSEVFGAAAIPSGYRVTFTVPMTRSACLFMRPTSELAIAMQQSPAFTSSLRLSACGMPRPTRAYHP